MQNCHKLEVDKISGNKVTVTNGDAHQDRFIVSGIAGPFIFDGIAGIGSDL